MSDCMSCKFSHVDLVYDEDDEEMWPEYNCGSGHEEFEFLDGKCPFYEESVRKPYIEKKTKCDYCKYLKKCISSGDVLKSTMPMDVEEHYIPNIGVICPL